MKLKNMAFLCLLAAVVGVSSVAVVVATISDRSSAMVLEIARFAVDRDNYTTKKLQRAGKIPEETLDDLQRALLGEFTRAGMFKEVRKLSKVTTTAAPGKTNDPGSASGPVLILAGTITDYKKGSRAARLLVGLGAGGQKFEVECVLKDRATGKIIGKQTVIDRKWGGLTGGDETKGRSDFAEKVVGFVRKALADK